MKTIEVDRGRDVQYEPEISHFALSLKLAQSSREGLQVFLLRTGVDLEWTRSRIAADSESEVLAGRSDHSSRMSR